MKHMSNIPQTNAIFQQPWWLDAVSPDAWGAAEVKHGDSIQARFPYVIRKRSGFKFLTSAPLTPILGPWLAPSLAKYPKQLAQQKELMFALIDQLPRFDFFVQNFHHSITNWLPFYWRGYTQTTRYTYIIQDLTNMDRIWNEVQENVRRNIRKAQKQVVVRTDLDIDRFLDINAMTFTRQGKSLPYSRDLVCRLDAACVSHDARRIFFAEDAQGRVHAAVYLVWDNSAAYYLMGGVNPEFSSSGATSLLLWEAIQFAATVTQTFNFEGSMIESIEHFFRNFGGRQVPYSQISKINTLPLKIYMSVRSWFPSRNAR